MSHVGKVVRLRQKLSDITGAVSGIFGRKAEKDPAVARLDALKVISISPYAPPPPPTHVAHLLAPILAGIRTLYWQESAPYVGRKPHPMLAESRTLCWQKPAPCVGRNLHPMLAETCTCRGIHAALPLLAGTYGGSKSAVQER